MRVLDKVTLRSHEYTGGPKFTRAALCPNPSET